MIDFDDFEKYVKRKKIIEQELSYLDIQILWCLLDALWRAKIVSNNIYYNLDEEFKWETQDRTWSDYGDFPCDDHYDYDYQEEDIYPQPKTKGKVKGQKMQGKPALARPGTIKGNKKR